MPSLDARRDRELREVQEYARDILRLRMPWHPVARRGDAADAAWSLHAQRVKHTTQALTIVRQVSQAILIEEIADGRL